MMTQAIQLIEPSAEVLRPRQEGGAVAVVTPTQLLQIAVERGATIEQMERLYALKLQVEADEARRAFNTAFAAFKAEAVKLVRTKEITDGPLRGKRHVELSGVIDAATPALSRYGLSTAWRLTRDDKDWMEVTCTLSHVAGHSESVSMGGAPDTGPGRNAIQARGSTKTYLERYTLTAILGLAASDADDDGDGGAADALRAECLAKVAAAATEEALRAVSKECVAKLNAAKDSDGYKQLRAAVQERGFVLKGGAPKDGPQPPSIDEADVPY